MIDKAIKDLKKIIPKTDKDRQMLMTEIMMLNCYKDFIKEKNNDKKRPVRSKGSNHHPL